MSHHSSFEANKQDSMLPLVQYFDTPLEKFLEKSGQHVLPQSDVMRFARDTLVELGIEEIYLRGSFSYSEADIYSDIDFFTVVSPEKLEAVHKKFLERMDSEYSVITECFDNVVDGYGGAGFTLLCDGKAQDRPVIFDIYFALKGLQPEKTLFECPRVYARDKNYCWLTDENAVSAIDTQAQNYIDLFQAPHGKEQSLKALAQEIMIVNATMLKHIDRGQIIRMTNDNWHLIGACIQMLQIGLDKRSYRSPYYTGDRIIQDCLESPFNEKREIGGALQKLVQTPVDKNKARDFFEYSKSVLETFSPKSYNDMQDKFSSYQRLFNQNTPSNQKPSLQPK